MNCEDYMKELNSLWYTENKSQQELKVLLKKISLKFLGIVKKLNFKNLIRFQ
jgi:hypothetical protein